MWLWSHEGFVIPVMDMAWKRSWRASWKPGDMFQDHMFQDHAGDSVRACCFVVRGTPESLLHDGRGNAALYHRGYVFLVGGSA